MGAELELLDASLPGTLPVLPGISLAGRYVLTDDPPVHRGDGMKVVALPGSRVALMIGDVVGSGAAGSTTMARLLAILRDRLQEGASALGAVRYVDRYAASAPSTVGATVAVAVVSLEDGRFECATAGHPPPLHWSGGGSRPMVLAPSRPLGMGGQGASAIGQLAPGDMLVLYTDGLLSLCNETLSEAHARIRSALNPFENSAEGLASAGADEACALLLNDIMAGERIADDVALLVAQRTSRPPPLDATGRSTPDQVALLAERLERWLDELGAGLLDHLALRQAFAEIAHNVVEHAYEDSTDDHGPLGLHGELTDDGALKLQVSDRGRWRERTKASGRGLTIAGGLVDTLRLQRLSSGTTVTLGQQLGRTLPVLQARQLPSHRAASRPASHPTLRTEVVGNRLIVAGEVSERCASEFRTCLHEATRAGTSDLVIDLSEVTLLASSGVRDLFEYLERARTSGVELTLTAPEGSIAEQVLRLVDLPHTS